MNITPVSFGKVVKVRGRKSTAENITSLANSLFPNSTHKTIQQEAKAIFDDITPSGQARVITTNSGRDVYIVSGEDSKIISDALRNYKSDLATSKLFMKNDVTRKSFNEDSRLIAQQTIGSIIKERQEPFVIKVEELKGEQHILKINKKA